jgi:hypothetical protein
MLESLGFHFKMILWHFPLHVFTTFVFTDGLFSAVGIALIRATHGGKQLN